MGMSVLESVGIRHALPVVGSVAGDAWAALCFGSPRDPVSSDDTCMTSSIVGIEHPLGTIRHN